MPQMTGKQQPFADYYLGEANFNATEAARLAGYSGNDVTLASVGYENLRKPQIREYIEARLAESCMLKEEAMGLLADLARNAKSQTIQLRAVEDVLKLYGLFNFRQEVLQTVITADKANGLIDQLDQNDPEDAKVLWDIVKGNSPARDKDD